MVQQNKRKLIPIVDRAFQFKYTGIIVAVAAVISSVLGYLLLQSYLEMNEIADIAAISPEAAAKLNRDDMNRVFQLTIAFLVLEVVVLGAMGLIITHRVVGPVAVLHRHLDTMLGGKYPSTRPLRQGDEFHAAFDTFQDLVEYLKKRDLDEVETLKAAIAAGRARGMSDDDLAALQRLVDERAARAA